MLTPTPALQRVSSVGTKQVVDGKARTQIKQQSVLGTPDTTAPRVMERCAGQEILVSLK